MSELAGEETRGETNDPVLDWRLGELVKLGFSERQAGLLANSRSDLHEIERQLTRGCSLDQAVRIFR